jgi:glycosyltransferase involved in cell wall biosynthesis
LLNGHDEMDAGSISRSRQAKISVALCTFNGERYLANQLASIKQQTRPPDEVVVSDDRSTDRTVQMVREFAASVPFPVRIFENEHNLGFAKNFERAIQLCEGDLIALSDQDDYWYPIRLERSELELTAHPQAGLAFSDGDIVDDQDQLVGMRLWTSFGFLGENKRRLLAGDYTVLVKSRFVTGATVMFRRRMREICLPIGPGWVHDEWIVALTAAVAEVRPIEAPLIRYRKHSHQQIGLSLKPGFREKQKRHWTELSRQIGLLQEICSRLSMQPLSERGDLLFSCYRDHLRFAQFRYALPQHRLARLGTMLNEYSTYAACGSGIFSMATDLVAGK